MENEDISHREYAPYESAVAFLKKRLAGKDRVRWSFVIQGIPNEAAARTMSLQLNKRFTLNLEISLLSVEGPSGSSWRLAALSAPGKLPQEKVFHEQGGWLWALAAHYDARLESLAFQLEA